MYEVSARIQGASVFKVPLLPGNGPEDFVLDESGIQKKIEEASLNHQKIKLIFLCSPNNPTGTIFQPDSILRICKAAEGRCLVVVDEAYAEFTPGGSLLYALPQLKNLIILRTLSKAWAMAGARCGVAIANEELIRVFQKIRAPYPIGTPTINTVLTGTDPEHQKVLHQRVTRIIEEREFLRNAFLKIKSVKKIYGSGTNFLLVAFTNSSKIMEILKAKGVIVRDRSKEPGLQNCIRITVGSTKENRTLLDLLAGEGKI